MIKKIRIKQIRNNPDGSVALDRETTITEEDGQVLAQSIWTTVVYPQADLDLVSELSRDGTTLPQDFIDHLKTVYEPGLRAAFTPEVIQQYQDNSLPPI